mmetsp:Transcript_6398/g.12926  ORF Transcript_6398/g.12926 Transcript_6398/m.12926 type:complete len:92 (+) Transcript_6398:3-278(+)
MAEDSSMYPPAPSIHPNMGLRQEIPAELEPLDMFWSVESGAHRAVPAFASESAGLHPAPSNIPGMVAQGSHDHSLRRDASPDEGEYAVMCA